MIKFFANNLSLTATKTASTANAQYPVSNIDSPFRTKVWRSTSNSDNIVFDLGSIEAIDSIAIVDNWQNGFGFSGSITIEANATDSWGAPAFSTTLTPDVTFGVGVKEFTAESYRFWRLVFTSTLGYVEVSNVFIGSKTEISTNGIDYNWRYAPRDIKKEKRNRYGQKFIDDISTQKFLTGLKISVANTTELDSIFDVFDITRTVNPLFITIGDGTNYIIADEDRLAGQYYFSREPSIVNFTSGFYNVSFNLEEAK
jgi:hypothetical protein